ncbi:MAG: M23 family metallopeptidase [Burkholderiales bacterium]
MLLLGLLTAFAQPTHAQSTINLQVGWNLLGNGSNQAIAVSSLYGDPQKVATVWKWVAGTSSWQFYAPQLDNASLQSYATSKGLGVLATINPGEGYWVNAVTSFSHPAPAGTAFNLSSTNLTAGWNLVATGANVTPSAFRQSLSGPQIITLWAWDNALAKWYFYAPTLEAQGGGALNNYIASRGYLDFTTAGKTLGNGVGFWLNRPTSLPIGSLTLGYTQDPTPLIANFKASAGRFPTPNLSFSWPLHIPPAISSPFSPRIKLAEGSRYDWHRGIDIPGPLGEPVYSIADGKVEKVVFEGDPQAPEGGNTVYIMHTINPATTFHGKPANRFYSFHTHLNSIDPAMVVGATVTRGQLVGTVGQTGTTTFNHDHFEIRMQTTCSLEFQLENPASLCAQNGFDPQVNPVQFLFPNDNTPPELIALNLSGTNLSATVKAGAPVSDFDYIALVLKDSLGAVIYTREIGFNAREGFDAASIATLDVDRKNGVTFIPADFTSGITTYGMTFSYDLAGLTALPASGGLLIQDVWGNSRTFSLEFH